MDARTQGFETGRPGLRAVSLADKYDLATDRIFVSGTQAIVRLLLMQRERDRRAGLNTAGFVSGYRGSPLGGIDHALTSAKAQLSAADVTFIPGLNEELAATAVWGAQQAEMRGEGRTDGVFSIWYGKGPGVDRCGDVFRHANLAGTSKHGGVLALMGDDHTAESSTTAHQSEFHFVDVMMPVLQPAGVQEILDFGLYGWALSRFAGVWVGLKCVKDTIESTASIDAALERVQIAMPADFTMPPGGLNIRPADPVLAQEARLQDYKRDAMVAFVRANGLNRIITSGGARPRLGIITVGKSYLDVRQALDHLGIDEGRANELGLRLYKIGCSWPIEPQGLRDFARGLELVIVVEEKRSLIEVQLREELYGSGIEPVCVGKKDEEGRWLFPVKGALDSNEIAIAIGERLLRFVDSDEIRARLEEVRRAQAALSSLEEVAVRTPYFCSGCPHNTSTRVPEGMRAYAGIGCHYMVQWMDRGTDGFTQMGGEGANWVGEAPFSTRGHVFQNLGDGTYNHSGVLALRFAVASGTHVTFKILFNDAVAMTGGQPHEGHLTVDKIARQVAAEGVTRIAVVTDEPDKYAPGTVWPQGLVIRHRSELERVQRALSDEPGVSVMIYDQTCAAEKRRRRKRGTFPDPDRRIFINEAVCEGCGDCGKASNCVSVQPLETAFGRKRQIDQSSCNKDFSCVDGFCPSFVSVRGGKLRTSPATAPHTTEAPDLPTPNLPIIGARPYEILVTGVGGTGVVTLGAILGMAAHLEGKGCGMIDMAGLAQKGGAVFSNVKLARSPQDIHTIRVAAGEADLVLGCDLVVSGTKKVLAAMRRGETGVVVNTAEIYPGDFTRDPKFELPAKRIRAAIEAAAGSPVHFVDANAASVALLGQSLGANLFMLGHAWQLGFIPLSEAAIQRAIELNGEAVEMNRAAFHMGRRAAVDPDWLTSVLAARSGASAAPDASESLEQVVARRVESLTAYQDGVYARDYAARVARIAKAAQRIGGDDVLVGAVARQLYRLMAIKDEYEVARLYTDGYFARRLAATFEKAPRLEFHLAPPLLARPDPVTGRVRKMTFGPWIWPLFRLLAKGKALRGTPLDLFGRTAERRAERALLAAYQRALDDIETCLSPGTRALALEIVCLPEEVSGFGHVRAPKMAAMHEALARLLLKLRADETVTVLAAE